MNQPGRDHRDGERKRECDCGRVGVRWSPDFPFHFRILIGGQEFDIEHELGDELCRGMAKCYEEAEEDMRQAGEQHEAEMRGEDDGAT